MKHLLVKSLLLIGSIGLYSATALAQVDYSDPKQRNPQGSSEVEEGYQEHKKQYKEKKEREERKERGEIEEPYEVDPSGSTVRGPEKDEN